MKARQIAATLSCCWIVASGCCTCRRPYDDCGPVWSQGVCRNCNPEYRAGSVLNRNRRVPLDEEGTTRTDKPTALAGPPSTRSKPKTLAVARRRVVSQSEASAAYAIPEQRTAEPMANDLQTADRSSETTAAKTPSKSQLPPGTVPAPAGTKEGATRILSVTDHRLDESQRTVKTPVPRPEPKPVAEKRSNEAEGWKSAAAQDDLTHSAIRLQATDR
jgi:hypothetical protein